MTALTMGSLFTGVGGFDIAAERVGIDVLWQSENDKNASKVLTHHFPTITNYGDIHDIKIGRRKNSAPKVDVLAGGFPCQSYSVAGNRGGLAEDRGALWWEFHRLISEGQPTWVVGENVPGILSSSGGRDFTTIIESLIQLGYSVVWRILDAQWFRVPQRRRRVFVVGYFGTEPRPEILALAESLCGDTAPSRSKRRKSAKQGTKVSTGRGYAIQPTIVGRSVTAGPGGRGIVDWDTNPGYTMNVADGPQSILTKNVARKLTPLETERLQGFPDNWTKILGSSDSARYKQMGNAVAVPVVEWVLKQIVEANMGDTE